MPILFVLRSFFWLQPPQRIFLLFVTIATGPPSLCGTVPLSFIDNVILCDSFLFVLSPPSFLDPGYVWLVVASCCPAPSLLIPGGRSQYPADCFRHCGCYSVPPLRFRRRLIRFLFSDSFLLSRTYCVSECSPCIALCSVGGLSYIVKSIFLCSCDIFDLTPILFLFLLSSTAAQVSPTTSRCLHQLIDLV